jgi:hypothetical protein
MLAVRTFSLFSKPASLSRTLGLVAAVVLLTNSVDHVQSSARQLTASPVDVDVRLPDDPPELENLPFPQLLEMLDSPVFQSRERATAELTRRGSGAVGPMAKHYLKSSPEAAWRIKQSLETIGTSGDEATFLKSVGVLQLLVGNNSSQINEQLARLKSEWIQKQTQLAIDKLRAAGAEINDVSTPRRFAAEVFSNEPDETVRPRKAGRGKNLDLAEKTAAIDEIINGSLISNRKLVLGSREAVNKELSESQKMAQVLELQLAQQAIARADNFAFGAGVIVKFGKNWQGERPQFEELRNIDRLSQIIFEQQYIDNFTLTLLSELTSITSLEFDKCRFSGPALATIGLPEFVNSLRFRNVDIEVSTIDRISKLNVTSLLFDNCDFSPAAMAKMLALSSVNYLELIDQQLSEGDLKRLAKLKTLSQLKLSGTRFPFKAYKELTASRPDLYIDFTTTAFLGVRSVQGLRDSCQISDVVANSGAETGGLKINDVILKVDDNEIEQFNDLRANIALRKPGEKLKITVRRESEILELDVILGDFADAPPQ